MELLRDQCTIRLVRLDRGADIGLLSDEEQARARSFISEAAKTQYVAARVALRRLCAEYTGLAAEAVRFETGPTGKPRLATGDVEFNLAHAEDLAVYAFARGLAVGIDLERVRALPDMEDVAAILMPARELEEFSRLEGTARERLFFRAWTRNEAYAKLTGNGLAAVLESSAEPACWFYEFVPAPGFVGMLAMVREPGAVELSQFYW